MKAIKKLGEHPSFCIACLRFRRLGAEHIVRGVLRLFRILRRLLRNGIHRVVIDFRRGFGHLGENILRVNFAVAVYVLYAVGIVLLVLIRDAYRRDGCACGNADAELLS